MWVCLREDNQTEEIQGHSENEASLFLVQLTSLQTDIQGESVAAERHCAVVRVCVGSVFCMVRISAIKSEYRPFQGALSDSYVEGTAKQRQNRQRTC